MGRALPEAEVLTSPDRTSPRNYYELLGVHPSASAKDLKRAFFIKSKEVGVSKN